MMTDYEISQSFKQVSRADLTDPQQKLIKGLRSWYRKTGGLSEKQQRVLKDIEQQTVKV